MVGGESAGGHLASLLAITPNAAEYQPDIPTADTSVQGCIDLYGVHDFTDANMSWRDRDPRDGFRFFVSVRGC